MKITIKAILFESPDNIRILPISVDDSNKILIRKKLEFERNKMIDYLKYLIEKEIIKSLFKPRNKSIQYQLDNIINAKKITNQSIQTVKTVFF